MYMDIYIYIYYVYIYIYIYIYTYRYIKIVIISRYTKEWWHWAIRSRTNSSKYISSAPAEHCSGLHAWTSSGKIESSTKQYGKMMENHGKSWEKRGKVMDLTSSRLV